MGARSNFNSGYQRGEQQCPIRKHCTVLGLKCQVKLLDFVTAGPLATFHNIDGADSQNNARKNGCNLFDQIMRDCIWISEIMFRSMDFC